MISTSFESCGKAIGTGRYILSAARHSRRMSVGGIIVPATHSGLKSPSLICRTSSYGRLRIVDLIPRASSNHATAYEIICTAVNSVALTTPMDERQASLILCPNPTNEFITDVHLQTNLTLSITEGGITNIVDLSTLVGDPSTSNEIQTLSQTGGVYTLSPGGGSITNADHNPSNELNQAFYLTGTNLNLTDAGRTFTVSLTNLIDDADADPTNELVQALSITGTDLEITQEGGTVNVDLTGEIVLDMLSPEVQTMILNVYAPPDMRAIPAGFFKMGNSYTNEGSADEFPLHTLYVSAFYMDKYEVSKVLWDEVYMWALTNGYSFDNAGLGSFPNHPVYKISWADAVKWNNARSEYEGLTPVYYMSSAQTNVYRTGQVHVGNDAVNWSGNGYRLPTEAEWEKAARGGLTGHHYPWPSLGGTYSNHIDGSRANYLNSGDPYETNSIATAPVDYYNGNQIPAGVDMANGYGLYDMVGNVHEWCWDWYDENWYSDAEATVSDSPGPTRSTNHHLESCGPQRFVG